jgi:predicted RND superfamily exporter protein
MERISQWIIKFRIPILIGIVILTILALPFIPTLEMKEDETTWFPANDSILTIYRNFKDSFEASEFVIIAYSWKNPFSPEEVQYLTELSDTLSQLPNIREVISLANVEDIVGTVEGLEIKKIFPAGEENPIDIAAIKSRIKQNPFIYGNLISRDFNTVAIMLIQESNKDKLKSSNEYNHVIKDSINNILKKEAERTGYRFHLGGQMITDDEVDSLMQRDIQTFFPLSMLISAIFLVLIFRNVISIISPLLTVFISLVWVIGLKGYLNSPITPVSTTLFALITIIGLANSIHLISQFRIEYANLGDKHQAVIAALKRAGSPCFFTSLTTAVGFGSLITSPIPAIYDLGIFAAFGIMVSFLLSILLIPISLLWLRPGSLTSFQRESAAVKHLLAKIANINEHYRWPLIFLFAAITIFMATGIPRIQIEGSLIEYLKHKTLLYQDTRFLDNQLSGVSNTEIILSGTEDTFKNPEILAEIESLQAQLAAVPQVSISYSMVDYLKMINRALNGDDPAFYTVPETQEGVAQCLLMYEISGGAEIEKYITSDYTTARISVITKQMNESQNRHLFGTINSFLKTHPNDLNIQVTGIDFLVNQVTQRIIITQANSLRTAFLIILALMLLIFGIKLGFLSIVPNVFPVVFLLGLMGWANFRLNMATAIIASVAIGMVVDDTIHYFTHFKHEYRQSGDIHSAMRTALIKVGRALIFTSMILVAGFLLFISSQTRILLDFGILSSIAVLTALLGDLFIGPVLLLTFDVMRKKFNKGSQTNN